MKLIGLSCILGLALVACEKAPKAAATEAPASERKMASFDACAMLPVADAEAALGEPAAAPRGQSNESRTSVSGSCTHFSANNALQFVGYTITRWKEPKDAESARLYLPKSYAKQNAKLDELSGLGTAAFWDGSSLFVFHADAQITVSVSNAVSKDPEVRLARAQSAAVAILKKV